MYDSSGRLRAILQVSFDITQRKQVEEALRESEERMKALWDNARAGIMVIDKESHRIIDVNRIAAELIGAPKEEIVGSICHNFVCPAERGRCPITDLGQKIDNTERTLLTVEGKSIPILKTVTSVVIKGREELIESFVDITKRKKLEQEIRDILDAAPDVIHVISPEMKVVNRNATSRRLFPQLKKGDYCYKVLHGREKPCSHCGVVKVFRDGRRHEHESTINLPDGREIIVHSTAAPIFNARGEITAAVEILRDITERKKAEERLRKAYEELKSLDEMKDDFLGTVTHELCTPLTSIMGALELLLEAEKEKESIDKKRIELLEIAFQESQRLDILIRHILETTKIESKLTEIAKEKLSLFELIDEALREIKVQADKRGINIIKRLKGHIPQLYGDKEYLKKALTNLLSNAVKFNKDGGEVSIEAIRRGGHIEISVTDTGIGIPKEHLDKIFEKFYRVETGTSRRYKGTGIGLAIVKKAIEAHGGSIKVESKVGEGSKFIITLPLEGGK
jgi:PAS domain S-box-containing protein